MSQLSQEQIIEVLERRLAEMELDHCDVASREIRNEVCRSIWRDLGAFRSDKLAPMFIALNKSIGHPEFTAPKTLRHTFATSLQDANVDPLIRNELMGHAPGGLGMTGVYTHTRPETKRQQLLAAEENRTCVQVAKQWLAVRSNQVSVPTVSEEPSDG